MHLKVAVCPHDSTKNKVAWLYFITYLSEKTGVNLSMEQCFEFECYYDSFSRVDMTYSSPLDALKIHKERGFIPVAGNDNYDEVVIVANEKAKPKLEAISGNEILCVENQFATYLGMKILNGLGLNYKLEFRDSWQSVLYGVSRGEAPYGFLYRDFWNQLSDISKKKVVLVYESNEKLSSHLVMLDSELEHYRDALLTALEDMSRDEKGAKLLEQLRISRWYPVDSLEYLKQLVQEV